MLMMFLLILNYALIASTWPIAKTALMYAKPFFLVGFRMIIGGIFLLGYLVIFDRSRLIIRKSDVWLFTKVILSHIYVAFMFEFWALQYVSSSKAVVICSSTPFVAAILSYWLLHERFSVRKTIALCIGITSLIPILATHESLETLAGQFLSVSLPEGLLLVSVTSGCYAWFVIKTLITKGYSLLFINGFSMFVGGIMCMLTSFVFEGVSPVPVTAWQPFLFWVLALVCIANIIFFNLYGWLLRYYSITFMTFAGFLTPIFGSFLGWFFLHESITWHYFVSLVLVVVSLTLFYQEEFGGVLKK